MDLVRNRRTGRVLRGALVGLLAAFAVACGDAGASAGARTDGPTTLRLGYFPNVTHATAVAGVEAGIFERALGPHRLVVKTFNAGPAAVEALFSGALDAAYLGPNPAINAFAKSGGEAIRIVSGATSGGAFLVVKPSIDRVGELEGTKLATPQLGGTQDVALRYWLRRQGFKTTRHGGGDVTVLPQENAQTLEAFRSGHIDGAWVPEPWATRLVQEGGGRILVDERDEWPGRRFVTTHLVVRTAFLEQHPGVVRRLLQGQLEANRLVNGDAARAQALTNDGIEKITGKKLRDDVMSAAWANLEFTNDPVASSLRASAKHATAVRLLQEVDLDGIYALEPLNALLRAANEPEVADR